MTAPDPLRVAVVGSGPAGFYAASNLLANGAEVDMYERLPTPWGLVRLGVAPDHPNIKAVSKVFEKVAQRPGFRFFGNVEIGTHLSADDLRAHYHAVIWSVRSNSARTVPNRSRSLEYAYGAARLALAFGAASTGTPAPSVMLGWLRLSL